MTPKVLSIFLMMLLTAGGSKVDERLKYLKQNPPSTIPEIFAPGLISKEGNTSSISGLWKE
jgi:hypothetical protein